ncbi:MAG: hypothetical protein II194_05595 [Bacteroidales bacterium]|nr:hypothetical protein [Bacteroidales bacterium]
MHNKSAISAENRDKSKENQTKFIVNALSRGFVPSIVMKWTGHNDYKPMRPYIDIVDAIKARKCLE